MPETPDFIVENHGTIVIVRPVTQAAKDWTEENVEGHWPNGIQCDHRPGWGLVDVLEDSGQFIVEIRHQRQPVS